MRHIAIIGLAALCACDSEAQDDEAPFAQRDLVDHANWSFSDAAEDPLADHRPATVDCPDTEYFAEGPGLEVETGACNYLVLGQPTINDIAAGADVHIKLAHFDLMAEGPAEAHVAVLIDGAVVWEQTVAIPSAAAGLSGDWTADAEYPAGTTIQFHLHNHGYNSWQLFELTVDDR